MLKTLAAKHQSTVTKMAARTRPRSSPRRTADLLRGQDTARGQAGPGSTIRRDTPHTRPARGHHRPGPGPGHRPSQGADLPAPQAAVRAMRARRHGGRPPGRRARQPRQARTGPARVGSPHGQDAAQDAHRLRRLPRPHPREPRRERGIVTGEPSASKGARWVRRKAARKRPALITRERDLAAQPIRFLGKDSRPRQDADGGERPHQARPGRAGAGAGPAVQPPARRGRVRRAGHPDRPAGHPHRPRGPARRAIRARPGRPLAGPRPRRRRRAQPEDHLVRDRDRPGRATPSGTAAPGPNPRTTETALAPPGNLGSR